MISAETMMKAHGHDDAPAHDILGQRVPLASVQFLRQLNIPGPRKRLLSGVVAHRGPIPPGNAVDSITLLVALGAVQICCGNAHTEVPMASVSQFEIA